MNLKDRLILLRMVLLFFGLLLIFPSSALASDDAGTDCPISMNDALTLEREQIEHLFKKRGITQLIESIGANLESSVMQYLEPRQSPDDPRPRGLLFYIGDAKVLCVIYWQRGDRPDDRAFIVERMTLPPAELVRLIDGAIIEMQQAEVGLSRSVVARSAGARAQLRGMSQAAEMPEEEQQTATDVLTELSHHLFPGRIGQHIAGLSSLTILPCLNIGVVPFGALDVGAGALADATTINVEAELRRIKNPGALTWTPGISNPAIFGNPDAGADEDWSFPPLPGAEREAVDIAKRLRGSAILGAGATPDRLTAEILTADYIHIAAHGLSSVNDPLDRSFLALTGGRLTAREIQSLKLKGFPLVVLSACQSGLGGPLDAGIVGIARAFVLAGAFNVVATLWNVDDAATAAIMVDFVDNLERMAPADALRSAQLKARSTWPHPRLWSGFMVFGSRVVTK